MSEQFEQEKIKPSWFWIKNSKGEASVSTTLLVISFIVTILIYAASAFTKIGSIELRPFDVGACSVVWIPIVSLYFGRRYTEAKSGQQNPT